jgi:nucleoid-associated protein EbfC
MNNKMLREIQQMQKQMEKAQRELGETNVEGTAGGGAVTVTMNGHREVQGLTIAPEVVDPEDVEMLQDMILAAINDASRKAQALTESKLGPLAGGLGGMGLGF